MNTRSKRKNVRERELTPPPAKRNARGDDKGESEVDVVGSLVTKGEESSENFKSLKNSQSSKGLKNLENLKNLKNLKNLENSMIVHDESHITGTSSASLVEVNSKLTTSSPLPLSMQILKPFWNMCCANCDSRDKTENLKIDEDAFWKGRGDGTAGTGHSKVKVKDLSAKESRRMSRIRYRQTVSDGGIICDNKLPMEVPILESVREVIDEYVSCTKLYGSRVNAGVMATLRYQSPILRVTGDFHDADMLALAEVLMSHCNSPSRLQHIYRLDFTVAAKYGKRSHGTRGFSSHGAFALAKVLQRSQHISQVFLNRNRIGSYGATAIFKAVSQNPTVKTLLMRACRIGERGALAFVHHICLNANNQSHNHDQQNCGLTLVDISSNVIGFKGYLAIQAGLSQHQLKHNDNYNQITNETTTKMLVDFDSNLVLQEIMSGVTHGLGIILCSIGTWLLSNKVRDSSTNHILSCAVYSVSLLVLYTSSTLFHSFFALTTTRYIFDVLDHCAIYILLAGSYTPFLRIALGHHHIWSTHLLIFLWICCFAGIFVEAFYNHWKYKSKFSLAMYLGMGWSCAICLPDLYSILGKNAIRLLILGGVGYTAGVPFFIRDNNLDHSIWHCFVLSGSILHWLCVYIYIAPLPSPHIQPYISMEGLGTNLNQVQNLTNAV